MTKKEKALTVCDRLEARYPEAVCSLTYTKPHELDLPEPLWLDKNERDWENFGMTRFLPDAFFETIPFERLEIEFIDPDAPKKKSRDPRNAF